MMTHAKLMHALFKGVIEANQTLPNTGIDLQFVFTSGAVGGVKSGQMRLLAVSGDKRLPILHQTRTCV